MHKPETYQDKMTLEEAVFWLECLEANLLDADYRVYGDSETDFKLAAIQRLTERNAELEAVLQKVDNWRDELNKVVGKAL
jgi:hypothetical protein